MESPPDFFLLCNGIQSACRMVGRVSAIGRDDLVRAIVAPAIPGPIGSATFEEVVLAPRNAGQTLFPASGWPTAVYVCQLQHTGNGTSQLQVIAWGELTQAREDPRA